MTTPAEYDHIAEALQSSLVHAMEAAERAREAGDESLRREIGGHAFDLRTTLESLREKAGRR